ncbi:MAG: winged helix-turn-helix transcriptional regulator [Caldilineaceae bacterium]|nr:winged helix-turn-helix transcriptional regulator [Caldilineaceae bacterium]
MFNEQNQNVANELQLFEALVDTPETTQADLAARVGVAVGTVNWYLKRWSQKGYIKIRRIGRWQWSYLLTPEGMAQKARLASEYLEASLSLYRRTRVEAKRLLEEVQSAHMDGIVLDGQGEIAEICRLTCLEKNIAIVEKEQAAHAPMLVVEGVQLRLVWPDPEAD